MKKTKQVMALLLALVMVVSMMPSNVQFVAAAAAEELPELPEVVELAAKAVMLMDSVRATVSAIAITFFFIGFYLLILFIIKSWRI